MRRVVSLRDNVLLGTNNRSPWPSPRPLRWTSRSRIVISRVTHGSHMRKSGMWSITLSSHLILPASTRVASAALVNALPVDPVKKIVSASTGWLVVMSRTPHPCASVTLPSSTIAMVTPGTPNALRSCSTRCSKPAGGAAAADVAKPTAATAAAKCTSFSIRSLLELQGLSTADGFEGSLPQLPHADGDERQDVRGEQDVGEHAVTVGDQRDEAEAAGEEHATDEQYERNGEPRTVRQRAAGARIPRMVDPLVDRMHRAGRALEQRREDHRLEEQMEHGDADPLQHEIGRQGGALHLGVEGDHRDEEEQSGKHRQRACDDARDNRVAVAGEVADHRQDHDRADDVVAEVRKAAQRPAGGLRMRREAAGNACPELPQRENNEQGVDAVKIIRNVAKQPLNGLVAECDDAGDACHQHDGADPLRRVENRPCNCSSSSAVDCEDEHREEQVAQLEKRPGRSEQPLKEAAVVVGAEAPRADEGQRTEDTEQQRGEKDRQEPAPRPARQKEFGE